MVRIAYGWKGEKTNSLATPHRCPAVSEIRQVAEVKLPAAVSYRGFPLG
jgi:hypothetical protein